VVKVIWQKAPHGGPIPRLGVNFLSLPSRSIGRLRYHWPQYLTQSSILLVWHSWHGTALNWFRSYLSSRCFRVKCNSDFYSPHTCLCGVPQGSVLGHLLFVMYITPLSTLVSSLSLNHHLYADDTQLFISFHPSDFHSNISHLQNALQQISSWMTANLLTLSSSKTEFLLIGLKQQLSKIQDCTVFPSSTGNYSTLSCCNSLVTATYSQ